MPSVYLSPSMQDFNEYITGGNEEYYMNLIVDAMVPYLRESDISFSRNNPNASMAQAVEGSNEGDYNFHLAIHSNASPENLAGMLQGPDVYYYAYSPEGETAANIFAKNLMSIYPYPDFVTTIPNTSLTELEKTKATSVLIELAYHDNYEDSGWIAKNVQIIAKNLAGSLYEYFSVCDSER